ncbi:MAG: peptidoglycan-binding protein [Alphaproteobacteria bacterium]
MRGSRLLIVAAAGLTLAACAQLEDRGGTVGAEGTRAAEQAYLNGRSNQRAGRYVEALAYFQTAARLGHAAAAYELGVAYNGGLGTDEDSAEAAMWINRAADHGDPRALFVVGASYYAGSGVEQDFALAVTYLGRAAVRGHARAQFLLGRAFSHGRGVERDPAWAARWFGKAASQGHVEAQFIYGVAHAVGLGVPENRGLGYRWLSIAAAQGHPRADEVRRALARHMDEQEMRRATRAAAAFRPVLIADLADEPTVMYVQHRLNELGFEAGSTDGVLGPRTRAAIATYRVKHGLADSVEVTPELLARLLAEGRDEHKA